MRLLLFIILLLPSVCFGQFGNFKQVRLVGTTDSTLIPGVAQIRFDPSTGKIRFGNGSSWFTYGGGMSTNLSNFDALSSTGFPVRTGSNTWAQRTLQSGNGMTVTNGDGVSGNPSYSWGNNDGGTDGNINDYTYIDPVDAGTIEMYFGSVRRFLSLYFYTSSVISMNLNNGTTSAQNTFSASSFEMQAGGANSGRIYYDGTTGILDLQFDSLRVANGKFFVGGAGTASQFNFGMKSGDPAVNVDNGDAYYNTTSNRFRGRVAGSWVNFITGSVVNADISASAAIQASKIADGSVSSAEFQYLGNVTSDIQTQINTNVVDRVTAGTGGSTIDLDMTGKRQRIFAGSASFSTAKNLTISNETSNTIAFAFTFEITDLAAVLTMETNVLMQDSRFDGDDWTATATGVYKMTGTYDGSNWLCEISANPYQ